MHQLEQINKLTDKVLQELKSIGIPVSNNIEKVVINTRTKKRLGACKKNVNSCGIESFIIEISARALACKEEQICNIIAHELIHTCPGSFNHGKKWKKYGEKTEALLGYHIKRTVNLEEMGIKPDKTSEKVRYTIICKKCGQKFERKRKCPLVEHPENYRCGKCGGRLKLL